MKDFIKITTKGRVRYIRKSAIIAVSEGPDATQSQTAKEKGETVSTHSSSLIIKDYEESILADQDPKSILDDLE